MINSSLNVTSIKNNHLDEVCEEIINYQFENNPFDNLTNNSSSIDHITNEAVAPPINISSPKTTQMYGLHETEIGNEYIHSMEDQINEIAILPEDTSLARLYLFCDANGCSRSFFDDFLKLFQKEILENNFNPTSSSITKRDAFIPRNQKKFKIIPPQAIPVELQLGNVVTIYKFNLWE